jgi:DNA-binding response OmpR family regulator
MAILVVDDDQAGRDALRRALTMQGYDVDLAADGEEALLKLRSHPNAHDLAIVDILMPRLDGLELTRRLRTDGNKLPILMLTARDQVSDRAVAQAGADDYPRRVRARGSSAGACASAPPRLRRRADALADLELNTGTPRSRATGRSSRSPTRARPLRAALRNPGRCSHAR